MLSNHLSGRPIHEEASDKCTLEWCTLNLVLGPLFRTMHDLRILYNLHKEDATSWKIRMNVVAHLICGTSTDDGYS